jgi:hypothetical protein
LQFKWVILTLLVPELLAGKELQDLLMARESCRAMKSFADEDGIEWSITQAYYANLGGYVLEFQNRDQREEQRQQNSCEKAGNLVNNDPHQNAATHILAAAERIFRTQNQGSRAFSNGIKTLFGGLPKESKENPSTVQLHNKIAVRFHPNADQVLALRAQNILPNLPSVPTSSIKDKSKGDLFVKTTALVQVVWLATQSAIRTSRHLPISLLELAVLAYSTSAFFTYILSFHKPQGINEPTYVSVPIVLDVLLLERILAATKESSGYTGTRVSSLFIGGPPNINILQPIPNNAEYAIFPTINGWKFPFSYYFVGMTFAGTLFAVIHCLAWNFHFPSSTDRLLWRVSSVLTVAWTPVYAVNFVLCGHLKKVVRGALQFGQSVEIILLLVYVLARCCLLVLVFRCLFFLETGAFIATLDGMIPHIQ